MSVQETGLMLQHVERRGEPLVGEARSDNTRLRGAAGMQRFSHGAKISDKARRQRSGNGDSMCRLLGIELAHPRAGRSRREGAHDCSWMKATLVEVPWLQRGDLRP